MAEQTKMLFSLLRLSLHAGKDNEDYYLSTGAYTVDKDWEQLFKLSVRQGVLLLAYGGLQRLPIQLQPPHSLKLRWCVNVVKGNERYDHYKYVIGKLSSLLSENNIAPLIIKGITISKLYPVPYFRESGDIDIYISGKTKQADDLISSLATQKKEKGIPKHSTFILEGIPIENHYTFFDTVLQFKREELLYQKMENMLNGMFSEKMYQAIKSDNIYQLHPQAAALHFIGHTFRHFCCLDMNIRQMCDWTMFFSKYKKDINAELLSSQIKELGLEKFVCHINSFCSAYLGFEPYLMISLKAETGAEQFILKTIMRYRTNPKIHIPVFGVMRYLIRRNTIYRKYLDKIGFTEFLLPEIKSYFIYLLTQRWRSRINRA
jgi:hypothetical protein